MNKIEVEILGTQSPFSNKECACPSYFIRCGDNKILLDCGSGSHRFFDMKNLDGLNILISHLHRDHYNDIFNYQYTSFVFHNQRRINTKINIYLPEFNSDISKDIRGEENAYCSYFEIDDTKECSLGDFSVEFCLLEHSNQVKMYAIKLKNRDKVIVYSGDVSYSCKDKLVKFAKDADLFICESSFLKEHGFPDICSHLTASQAATIAKEANVKKIVLTHLWPEEKCDKYLKEAKEIIENVLIAKEGEKISL